MLARIDNDPAFKVFGSADFDPVAFASLVVDADSKSQAAAASEASAAGALGASRVSRAEMTMSEMSAHVGLIDGAIQSHITLNRASLLGGVGGLQELQADVKGLAQGVAEVKRATGRISKDLGGPYEALMAKTVQLRRVAAASVLLRRVLRVQMTTRRLRALEPSLGLGALAAVEAGTADASMLAEVRHTQKSNKGRVHHVCNTSALRVHCTWRAPAHGKRE